MMDPFPVVSVRVTKLVTVSFLAVERVRGNERADRRREEERLTK